MKLLTFCYAGGHAPAYLPLKKRLASSEIRVVLQELPGRGARTKEPLLSSMDTILEDYERQITPHIAEPFAFFGHSMGALVAHLMTLRLLERGLPAPTHVFLSSQPPPPPKNDGAPAYLLPEDQFKRFVQGFDSSRESPDDPKLTAYLSRILRADFQAIETCDQRRDVSHDIPITGFAGTSDVVSVEGARSWQQYSSQRMPLYIFRGAHFYLFERWDDLARVIALRLAEAN